MAVMSDPNPSEKQLEVLRYIISYVEVNGYQPSQLEMAEHFSISKNAIQGRLRELDRRGLIEMPAGRERAVILKWVRYRAYSSSEDKPSADELRKKITENKNPMFMPELMSDG